MGQHKHNQRFIRLAFEAHDEPECEYCGRLVLLGVDQTHPARATADHVVPLSRGGDDTLDNLALCCAACNHSKGSLTLDEWTEVRTDSAAAAHLRAAVMARLEGRTDPVAETAMQRRLAKKMRKIERRAARNRRQVLRQEAAALPLTQRIELPPELTA